MSETTDTKVDCRTAAERIRQAAAAKKCWGCGCLHSTLEAIEAEVPPGDGRGDLDAAIHEARAHLTDVQYDCLGCDLCFPAAAVNALGLEGEACSSKGVEIREGWPPLPGSFSVIRYHAPIAICTLTDEALAEKVIGHIGSRVAIVGTMQTENLGIERLIQNIIADPNIRFLVVCGADSCNAMGHLPGQSLVSFALHGLDEQGRIVGARGKRPFIRNLGPDAVKHFRNAVEVVDLLGVSDLERIAAEAEACFERAPGPAEAFVAERLVTTVQGHLPVRMVVDPAGYFVVYVDRSKRLLLLEHYTNKGVLDIVIEGRHPAELYTETVARGLISRLDHAAYLGRELARAEEALRKGELFVQDAAPEYGAPVDTSCECDSCFGGNRQ